MRPALKDDKRYQERRAVLLAIVKKKSIRPCELQKLTGCKVVDMWLYRNMDLGLCEDDRGNISLPKVLEVEQWKKARKKRLQSLTAGLTTRTKKT